MKQWSLALMGFLLAVTSSARAAAPPLRVNEKSAAPLIALLGVDEFPVREAAARKLARLGRVALPHLRRGLASSDPEVRHRCNRLIQEIDADRIALRAKGAVFRTRGNDPDGPVTDALLRGKSIGDADLAHLAGMVELRDLCLTGAAISDDGLRHLAGLRSITHLSLDQTRITGNGLAHLRGLKKLQVLHLDRNPIQDRHLLHLCTLPNLRSLTLRQTPVTDRGLELLAETNVAVLLLDKTNITDAGMVHVARMKNLYDFQAMGVHLSYRGLRHLRGHKTLRYIQLEERMCGEAVKKLIPTLPKYGVYD